MKRKNNRDRDWHLRVCCKKCEFHRKTNIESISLETATFPLELKKAEVCPKCGFFGNFNILSARKVIIRKSIFKRSVWEFVKINKEDCVKDKKISCV